MAPAALRGERPTRRVAALPRRVRRYAERSFLALDPGPRALFFENFAVFPAALQRRAAAGTATWLDARDPYAAGAAALRRQRPAIRASTG